MRLLGTIQHIIIVSNLMAYSLHSSGQLLRGRIQLGENWVPVLYLNIFSDLENEMESDSIILELDGSFFYRFSADQQRSGLVRLSIIPLGEGRHFIKEGVGENSVVFPVGGTKWMSFYAEADDFFFTHQIAFGNDYSAGSFLRDLKKPLRDLLIRYRDPFSTTGAVPNADVFREEWEEQVQAYKMAIQSFIDTVQQKELRLLGLYHHFMSNRGRYDTALFKRVLPSIAEKQFGVLDNIYDKLRGEGSVGTDTFAAFPPLEDTIGRLVHLDTMRASYYVLDFWASWCSPCRKAMQTTLPRLYQQFKRLDVQLIGINVDSGRQPWLHALRTVKPDWPQFREATAAGSWTRRFNISGFPTYVVLDGQFRYLYASTSEPDIRRYIEKHSRPY